MDGRCMLFCAAISKCCHRDPFAGAKGIDLLDRRLAGMGAMSIFSPLCIALILLLVHVLAVERRCPLLLPCRPLHP